MLKNLRTWFWIGLALLGLLMVSAAHAQGGATEQPVDAFEAVGKFGTVIQNNVTTMVQNPGSPVRKISRTLFLAMAITLLVWKAVGWALRGFDVADMVFTAAQITICATLMAALPTLLPAAFEGAMFIGGAMMAGITGVPLPVGEEASIPTMIMKMMSKWTFAPVCTESKGLRGEIEKFLNVCLLTNFAAVMASVVAALIAIVLGIASLVVNVWGYWGFALSLATGLIFVPFMLYERLQFLFDGWVKFFFGFLIYVIVAHVNMALVASVVLEYLGSGVAALMAGRGPQTHVAVPNFSGMLGILMFMGVGIFTLCATGSFASAMVSGAGGGGVKFGQMARAASAFAGGAAAAVSTTGAAVQGGRAAAKGGASKGEIAKAAGKAGLDKFVATQKNNKAFNKGYAVGREAAAGAINGYAKGLKFGADPKTPTGGGTATTKLQRLQGAMGGAMGGASAAVRTTAAVSLGRQVGNSFATQRDLKGAEASAVKQGFQAAQFLDSGKDIGNSERQRVEAAISNLNETLNKAKTGDEVRQAGGELREAMQAARGGPSSSGPGGGGDGQDGGGGGGGGGSAAPAAVPDPEFQAAMAELDNEERERNGGFTLAEWDTVAGTDKDPYYQAAMAELDNEERERNGGFTLAEQDAMSGTSNNPSFQATMPQADGGGDSTEARDWPGGGNDGPQQPSESADLARNDEGKSGDGYDASAAAEDVKEAERVARDEAEKSAKAKSGGVAKKRSPQKSNDNDSAEDQARAA
jgi:TrbL/VirB6 plasmid conjugal transfer protein